MARAKVTHSTDGCTIEMTFNGDKSNPEPSTGVIKFPGGHIEVSRTSDGDYWVHTSVDKASNIIGSRIDYDHEKFTSLVEDGKPTIPPIPGEGSIQHIAIRVAI